MYSQIDFMSKGGATNEHGLTHKQQAFVDNYLQSFNATEAAEKAGYDADRRHTLEQIGFENLRKPEIVSQLSIRYKQIAAKSEKQLINTHDEFCEQLAFAKKLRIAAEEYLSDVEDPLKLSITPKAHEIEVTYYDHNDKVKLSFGGKVIEKPRKKRAMLSTVLESFADHNLQPEKYKFTTADIRKFALEAIDRADMCIDKFARMGGDYSKEKENPNDLAMAQRMVREAIAEGKEREAAVAFAAKRYGVLQDDLIGV